MRRKALSVHQMRLRGNVMKSLPLMSVIVLIAGCAATPDPEKPGQALVPDAGIPACVAGVVIDVGLAVIGVTSGFSAACNAEGYIPPEEDIVDTR